MEFNKNNYYQFKWFTNKEEIDRLNRMVDEKVKSFVEDSKKTGKEISPEVDAVYNGKCVVYKNRNTLIPIIFSTVSISILLIHYNSPWTILTAGLFSFFWYDFFSGILHVVLDNPQFIKVPILCDPCLEFQWHHHIPFDIANKSFLEVCGDLNLTVMIIASILLVGLAYRTPMALCLIGFKLLMAYFGQLCHRMSHTPIAHRPRWINYLQSQGVMLSPSDHSLHHKDYNNHFCIGSGLCNGVISWIMSNVTSNKYVWLIGFLSTGLFDVPIANYVFTRYLGFE